MPEFGEKIRNEVEPDPLYKICSALTETAGRLRFHETPEMLQIGFSADREVG